MRAAGRVRVSFAVGFAILALAVTGGGSALRAEIIEGSKFALPVSDPGHDWLAQRVIDREWGASDDSIYKEVLVPGWKSEGWAMAMSAALPGTGQLYVGEGSGWLWLVSEAAGLAGTKLAQRKADRYTRDAARLAGSPYDSSSGWSLSRWQQSSSTDAAHLEALWAGDREAYFQLLASDPVYLSGWAGPSPATTVEGFRELRARREDTLHRKQLVESFVWIQHLVSAVDAFRAARFHNLPLRQQYQLRVSQRMRHGRPELRAAIVRRF